MKILNQLDHIGHRRSVVGSNSLAHENPRPVRSVGQQASIVTLRPTVLTPPPSLYDAQGVVAAVSASTAPDLLAQLRQRLREDYPDLRQAARQAIQSRLHDQYGVDVDADRTWFDTFAGGATNARSYNGWEHLGAPLASVSLTDLQLQNFPADFGEDPNGLNANSGVYRVGNDATRFDDTNDVRLLSSDLKAAIRAGDFQADYRRQVAAYWQRNENAVALHYEALALEHLQDPGLSAQGRSLVTQAAGYHQGDQAAWRGYVFDINSYPSKNMAWLQAPDGRVVLLSPHGAKPLREYASVDDMRRGMADLVRTEAGRDELLRGFSIYNQQDGVIYQGIEKWLGDIAAGGYEDRIAMRPRPIEGRIFDDMARRSRDAALDDVSRLIRSNSDIGKQEMLQAMRAFNDILGSAATQVVEAGYALYAARTEGALQDRRDAASRAWVAGLSAAAMVLLDGTARELTVDDLPAPRVYYKPPTRLSDGRFGYPLGPVDAPRLPGADGLPAGSPWQEHPLDLSPDRTVRPYREPDNRLTAPRNDIPESGAAQALDEPLDLSHPVAGASVDAQTQAGRSGWIGRTPLRDPVTSGQINHLGFRERYDFHELYGFQSFGGTRLARTVAGLQLSRPADSIAQMIEGDMLRTFPSIEAAEDAARRGALQNYRIYRIRADGLRAASFQDNRLNNPLFESLRLPLTQAADHIAQPYQRRLERDRLLRDAEQEIHLSTECLDRERVTILWNRAGRH